VTVVTPVLIEDPDLAEGLSDARREEAERACLAKVVHAEPGPWTGVAGVSELETGFGLLVLDGLMSRRVGRGGRFGAELLGPGDLMRPWDEAGELATLPFETDWRVIEQLRLAVLDRAFSIRAAPFPEIASELLHRSVERSHRLAASVAIVHEPRIQARLDMLVWTLAERWGTVRPDGVALTLPLTHALLADMVAASRPAVTSALSAIEESGRLRRDENVWLLQGGPPPELDRIPDRVRARG
jgi:CRP-like cAMP-binding protein